MLDILDQHTNSSCRCLFLSFLVAFILRTRLAALNRSKDATLMAMSEQEKKTLDDLGDAKELSDSDPRFKYMT